MKRAIVSAVFLIFFSGSPCAEKINLKLIDGLEKL